MGSTKVKKSKHAEAEPMQEPGKRKRKVRARFAPPTTSRRVARSRPRNTANLGTPPREPRIAPKARDRLRRPSSRASRV
jgi:hypothetical protein